MEWYKSDISNLRLKNEKALKKKIEIRILFSERNVKWIFLKTGNNLINYDEFLNKFKVEFFIK